MESSITKITTVHLHNGTNLEVIEGAAMVGLFVNDKFINGDTFIKLHFVDDGGEVMVKKRSICMYYENSGEE